MAKWFLASACFAAMAASFNISAWFLPATLCVVTGFVVGFRNGR